jgi:ATP-dependent helicase/nuclease subunit B
LSRPDPKPNVLTIAASLPFAETLARGLIARLGTDPLALSAATIYLPTRRAARSFADVFARVLGGAALLPDFKALGDVDEDEFLFDSDADDLDLTPTILPMRRRLLLATLVKRWDETRRQGRLGFAQAAALAGSLASLMDEMETQGADLSRLGDLVPRALAEHWAEVLGFLELLRDQWPALLAAEGTANPAARRNEYLKALAKRIVDHPPQGLVIAAGSTGSIPATGELLGVIARLPKGMVVLPGLDRELDADSWNDLDPGHPQYGMKQLLERIEVKRKDVGDWSDTKPSAERELLLRETLRPAPTTDAWRALAESGGENIAQGLKNISLIEAADPAEEASVIALALREALETKGQTAALVTPDRALARRVAANLLRWDIAIDDSAGQPLSHTPPGTFLNLLAEAAESGFAPVPLLALLKHPLATMGGDAGAFRENARKLDIVLRGPRPDAGLNGIAHQIDAKEDIYPDLAAWFAKVSDILHPLGDALAQRETFIADAVTAHLTAAEALSSPDTLWRGDAGANAATLFADLVEAAIDLPAVEASAYTPLFRDFARRIAIRPAYGKHPRLAILGAQEARLQSFDLIILGSLNEGTWPQSAATDPWFSRPMRKALGLELPEFRIGQSAHDFATLAAGPRVMLTRSTKTEGAPTIPSRWVQRLIQLTRGLGLEDALNPKTNYLGFHHALEEPEAILRIKPPAPKPPVKARPRKLSVTEIETWLRDPYAIYARRILKLDPLDPLDAEIGPLERGSAVHKALEEFVREFPDHVPDGAEMRLIAYADAAFHEAGVPRAVLTMWRPRFINAAHWFVGVERERRAGIARSHLEIRGERVFVSAGGDFTLYGRADRIDALRAGGAAILDYKTGAPPSHSQVRELLTPQLPLEAAILESGGFENIGAMKAAELIYIRFAGGAKPGEVRLVDVDAEAITAEAIDRLAERIAFFDDETTPYLSRVKPYRTDISGDYDHLARVREWSLAGWEDGE